MTTPAPGSNPLDNAIFRLRFPRSIGAYNTYAEVQAVVDTLADREFPVENTMIVGTDLKLIERVTGRRTWGRVIGGGIASGVWMGLFIGLLMSLVFPGSIVTTVLMAILLGIVFFTIWAAIGYATSGGRRDFTSMTATIPMQYELLVEHSFADRARQVLAEAGGHSPAPAPDAPTGPAAQATAPSAAGNPASGSTTPERPTRPRPDFGRPAGPQDAAPQDSDRNGPAPRA